MKFRKGDVVEMVMAPEAVFEEFLQWTFTVAGQNADRLVLEYRSPGGTLLRMGFWQSDSDCFDLVERQAPA
ncbi:MAG TPA: hypothetical protein VIM33_04805 [Gaiellaceae bacterium]|jgi:hypothetical protein